MHQDHNGFLPESDFTTREETAPKIITGEGKAIWRLKQWVYEAVLKGQYTVEQFSTLFQQRQDVKKAIFSHSNGTAIPSSLVPPDSSNNSPGTASTTLSFIASSYFDESCELNTDEDEYFHSRKHCPDKAHQQLLDGRDVATTIEQNTPSGPSYRACTWMCCQRCRPYYHDQAWLSLDAVVNETTKAPPSWEMENRRISDVRVVAKIGLPKPDLLFRIDDSRCDSSSEAPRSSDGNLVESETDRCAYGSIFGGHQKEGLRVAVGRPLNRATSHTRASSSESWTSSKNSSQSSPRQFGLSLPFRLRRSSQSTIAYRPHAIEDDHLQEPLTLMVAVDTPLPDAAGDVEDLHNGEVEVEDGVAVTEEGVE